MKVFITGATGFIGSEVVKELLANGHQVLGLARSDESAKKLTAMGAEVYRGDLTDPDSLKSGVQSADGVIHTGFVHDFSRFAEVCALDGRVIAAMGEAVAGSDRPIIVASGTALVVKDGVAEEQDRNLTDANPRSATEKAVDELALKGIRASLVRLPPSVHGDGDKHGFVPLLVKLAKEKGFAAYAGDGQNVWPAVHVLDAARLFRLALENAAAGGTRFHAVDDTGVPFKNIASAIGEKLQLPVRSLDNEEAAGYFTWFSHFATRDNKSSSGWTRHTLGWQPTHNSLIKDLESGIYFNG